MISIASAAAASPEPEIAAPSARNAPASDTARRSKTESHSLVDVHAHFIPDGYRRAAIAAGHSHPDGMPGLPAWSAGEMLAMMDRIGIATAILSISSPGVHFGNDAAARALAREVNLAGAELRNAHPDRFGFFASLPLPDVAGSLEELAYALDELHADGIMIESNHGGIYPGDPAFEPLFVEFDRRGAVVFMHPTSPHCASCSMPSVVLPGPILEFMFETTRAVTNLLLSGTLDRYRQLRMIVPHGGAVLPVLVDRVAGSLALLGNAAHVSQTTMFEALARLYYDVAGAPLPRLLPALRTLANPRRLLYGSDWPFTPEPAVTALLSILLNAPDVPGWSKPQLCRGNAEQLFPRLSAG